MIEVSSTVKVYQSGIQLDFIRASDPEGQNVNKIGPSVQLRFDIRNFLLLEPDVKERLIKLTGSHVTEDDILINKAKC